MVLCCRLKDNGRSIRISELCGIDLIREASAGFDMNRTASELIAGGFSMVHRAFPFKLCRLQYLWPRSVAIMKCKYVARCLALLCRNTKSFFKSKSYLNYAHKTNYIVIYILISHFTFLRNTLRPLPACLSLGLTSVDMHVKVFFFLQLDSGLLEHIDEQNVVGEHSWKRKIEENLPMLMLTFLTPLENANCLVVNLNVRNVKTCYK